MPHVTKKPLWREEQTCHFLQSRTASALQLVPQPEYVAGRSPRLWGDNPALLYVLKDRRFCVQILRNGQGPIYLEGLIEVPCFMFQQSMELHPLLCPTHCRLLALLFWTSGRARLRCSAGRKLTVPREERHLELVQPSEVAHCQLGGDE